MDTRKSTSIRWSNRIVDNGDTRMMHRPKETWIQIVKEDVKAANVTKKMPFKKAK